MGNKHYIGKYNCKKLRKMCSHDKNKPRIRIYPYNKKEAENKKQTNKKKNNVKSFVSKFISWFTYKIVLKKSLKYFHDFLSFLKN